MRRCREIFLISELSQRRGDPGDDADRAVCWRGPAGKLPQNHDVYYDAELLSLAKAQLESSASWIDLSSSFEPLAELEPLFYRTDHHWTSLGAYRAYEALLSQWSISPTPPSQFQVASHPDFYGTSYSKSALWGVKPDTMEIWDQCLPVQVMIYEDPSGEASTASSMFYPDNLAGVDPYSVFLNGNHALTRIVNPLPTVEPCSS